MTSLTSNIAPYSEQEQLNMSGGKDHVNDKAVNHPPAVIIAGGGTGGHLFPGIAIAHAFKEDDSKSRILFVNAGKPIDKNVLKEAGFDLKCISAEGIKGKTVWQKIKSALKIPKGIFESILILKSFRPDIVIGVGGYSSGPLIVGAWLLGIPSVLHEQNMIPGITNRLLSRFVSRIYVTFDKTKINKTKARLTGNPVRKEILQCAVNAKHPDTETAVHDNLFTILILGGSQGAHSINMAVIDALKHIREPEQYYFIHQTGSLDEKIVTDAYNNININHNVQPFFNDMAEQYRNADLIICRAGATTIAEVSAIGRGVIFIPYPFAADNHQLLNAETLADQGAAEIIEEVFLKGENLATKIEFYKNNRPALKEMASKLMNFGKPNAAELIVEDCFRLLKKME